MVFSWIVLILILISFKPTKVYASEFLSVSDNSLQEDLDEIDKDDAASITDDGQAVYLVSQLYNNLEVMLSGIIKLMYVETVVMCLVLGAIVAFGIVDHFMYLARTLHL